VPWGWPWAGPRCPQGGGQSGARRNSRHEHSVLGYAKALALKGMLENTPTLYALYCAKLCVPRVSLHADASWGLSAVPTLRPGQSAS
jgi:hypothetical protein